MSNLSEHELIRREKLNKIRELGINPYPAELFQVTTNSSNIKSNFIEGEKVIVAVLVLYLKNKYLVYNFLMNNI